MKDVVIKWKWIKREIILILLCYIVSNLINLVSISVYNTSWNEVYTSQAYVFYLTEWLYAISILVRLIGVGIRYLIKS